MSILGDRGGTVVAEQPSKKLEASPKKIKNTETMIRLSV